MNQSKRYTIWLQRLALILFAASIMFYNLIPFTLIPTTFPAPDIVFCVICTLLIRRPEIVPFWMIGLIYFGFDIFLMKPLGVWTACILIATEILRAGRNAFRENLFPFELASIALIFFAVLLVNRLILLIAIVPTPPISYDVWEFVFTVFTYPVILFTITYILRIRKPALGEFGVIGHKL